jgi:hypothetical protein
MKSLTTTDPVMTDYLRRVPKAPVVVIHSFAPGNPRRALGRDGFRAWIGELCEGIVPCNCNWAPQLDMHYVPRSHLVDAE